MGCLEYVLFTLRVRRVNLRLAQDPNSEHLGTTVWDASIVLAKYFEKVSSAAALHPHCSSGSDTFASWK